MHACVISNPAATRTGLPAYILYNTSHREKIFICLYESRKGTAALPWRLKRQGRRDKVAFRSRRPAGRAHYARIPVRRTSSCLLWFVSAVAFVAWALKICCRSVFLFIFLIFLYLLLVLRYRDIIFCCFLSRLFLLVTNPLTLSYHSYTSVRT